MVLRCNFLGGIALRRKRNVSGGVVLRCGSCNVSGGTVLRCGLLMLSHLSSKAETFAEQHGSHLIPFGMDHEIVINAIAQSVRARGIVRISAQEIVT